MDHEPEHGRQHAMLAVGEETSYPSRLPMVTDPAHHPQVFLKAPLARGRDDLRAADLADRRQSGATVYAVQPGECGITRLNPDHPRCTTPRPGAQFRDRFERPGKEGILPGVTLNVARVGLSRELLAAGAPRGMLAYLLDGTGPDLYRTHAMTRPPNRCVWTPAVRATGHAPPADASRRGRPMVARGRPDATAEPLRAGERVTGEVPGGPSRARWRTTSSPSRALMGESCGTPPPSTQRPRKLQPGCTGRAPALTYPANGRRWSE